MKSVYTAIAVIGIALPALAHADDDLSPAMDSERPVLCLRDTSGLVWRLQCNPATHVCLYAPNEELDAAGHRTPKELERARTCELDAPFDRAKLEADGFKIVPGRVDAPYGWMRDERQRVFQINFDLRKRMYFGVAYTPQKMVENPFESKRTSIDFGLLSFNWLSDGETPTLHRFKFFEGQVHMQPFSAEIVMAHYDVSRKFVDPLLRFTTFVGTPSRHDLTLDLGLWSEVGGLELHKTPQGNSQLWKHGTAQFTLDLWQSPDLNSFMRVRSGIGLEGQHDDVNGYRSALTETSAFELDTVLDPDGFHNLRFELDHEMPRYFTPLPGTAKWTSRYKANVQYETIVLAINDQPLTLKLAAGGEKRDDIPGIPNQWAFVVDAGLRFSLWAPPRSRS